MFPFVCFSQVASLHTQHNFYISLLLPSHEEEQVAREGGLGITAVTDPVRPAGLLRGGCGSSFSSLCCTHNLSLSGLCFTRVALVSDVIFTAGLSSELRLSQTAAQQHQ